MIPWVARHGRTGAGGRLPIHRHVDPGIEGPPAGQGWKRTGPRSRGGSAEVQCKANGTGIQQGCRRRGTVRDATVRTAPRARTHVVLVAPEPVLTGLERADDRVRRLVEVRRGVLAGELSQQPTCPQVWQTRRWTQCPPSRRHSWQPSSLGVVATIVSRWSQVGMGRLRSMGEGRRRAVSSRTTGGCGSIAPRPSPRRPPTRPASWSRSGGRRRRTTRVGSSRTGAVRGRGVPRVAELLGVEVAVGAHEAVVVEGGAARRASRCRARRR